MATFLTRAPAGFPGAITRPDETVVESAMMNPDPDKVPQAFGDAVKMVDGKLERMATGDTGAQVYGVLARTTPSIAGDMGQTFADAKPNPAQLQGVVVKGYVNVLCRSGGLPVRGTPAFIRTNFNSDGSEWPGQWSAKKNSNNFSEVPGSAWSDDGKDGDLTAELRLGI